MGNNSSCLDDYSLYKLSMVIIKQFLRDGLITREEYRDTDYALRNIYKIKSYMEGLNPDELNA